MNAMQSMVDVLAHHVYRIAMTCMAACTESIEDKAAREAEEYTQKVNDG